MNFNFKIHCGENGGYWGECIELKGCMSQGKTLDELKKNLKNALDLYLDEPSDSDIIFPEPKLHVKDKNIIQIKADSNIMFSQYLRMLRIKNKMTQKEASEKMGFKNVWSYQILESSRANPSLKTISNIKETFPDFDMNIIL